MLRKLLLSLALVFVIQVAAPVAAEACGGPFEVPCLHWSWCAFTTPSIFGPVCWGGFVPDTPWLGCDDSRLNMWGICIPCGTNFEPQCMFSPTCDPRHNPIGLCVPCGSTGEPVCFSGASCDPGNRSIFGFCSYSGFSEEPTTNLASMPALAQPGSGSDPVRGIADLHTHQFSNLGFGGVQFWGAPYDPGGINEAIPWCDYTWKFAIKNSILNIDAPVVPFLGYEAHGPKDLQALTHIVSNGIPEGQHDVAGTGPFDGWPTYNTYTHQQMYYKWVERAFLGGLRLMVLHAVSNEALCKGSKRRSDFTCNDMEAVDKEIQAAKELERAIDRMDDNVVNGTGWYRIAYSPSQARQIIRSGKMAVVLGIEVDSLFNCKPGTPCPRAFLRSELQRYYNMGVRQVFPIHQFDNAFGGAAIFRDELNAGNGVVTGSHFQVRDCSAQGYDYNVNPSTAVDIFSLIALGVLPPNQAYYDQFAADCNARGLTGTGQELIEEMMDLKFIIDIDHMSNLMTDQVLDLAETTTAGRPNVYPLVSSHTGYFDLKEPSHRNEFNLTETQVDRLRDLGGMVTANNPKGDCSTTRGYREAYDYAVEHMKKDEADAFPAVGFSTDMNGFAGSTGPRFGPDACGPDSDPLGYPFAGVMGGAFNRQVTGDRTFDLNTQGVAHYGMLADFFADLKRTGMTDAEIDPLLNSAESYIRMWEAIDNSDNLPPPQITSQITGTAGTNGWYISDVTVEWDVTGAEGAMANTTNCGPTTITTDTTGTTLTCHATNAGTGESSSASVTIRRDATAPTFTALRLTATPATGWTNQNVRVRFTASDAMSGMGGNPVIETEVSQEGAGLVADHEFFDQAGNSVMAQLGGINIDRTPPLVGFRFSHLPQNATPAQIAAEQARWHNQTVTLLIVAQDALSGIASYTPEKLVFASEGTNLGGSATATDLAGNVAKDTSDPIRIDLTPPTIELVTRLPAPNAHGWNNAAVTVTWACGDVLSGVQAPVVSRTLSGEGENQSATQECADVAGNTTPHTQPGISIDMTPPALEFGAQQPAANANGWNNTEVSWPFTPTDHLSGVAATSIPSPLMVSMEGMFVSGAVTVTDRADNSAEFMSPGVQIDMTPPSIAFVDRLPLANGAGWNDSDITIRWTCADGLSGPVAANIVETLMTEGANVSLTGRCVDMADNLTTDTRGGLNLDKTAPTLTYAPQAPLANMNGWNNADVAFAFTTGDNLSGVAGTSIPSPLVLGSEGAAVSGQVTVTDVADNSATFTSPSVRIDKTAPLISCVADPGVIWPPNNGMVPVTVAMTFTDGLSGTQAFALTDASSNEPGIDDIQGFVQGQPVLSGELRGQRLGSGTGRIYTLEYLGEDLAGNTAACSTGVTVPHDQRTN